MSELYGNEKSGRRWVDSKAIQLGWITILNKQQAESFGMNNGDFLPVEVSKLEGKLPLSLLRKIKNLTSEQISALTLLCKVTELKGFNYHEYVDLTPIIDFLNGF